MPTPKPKSKSKSLKRPSSKQDQKPGAVARRVALQKEPRTLERALSFEQQHRRSVSRGPSQIVDLMRATSTSIPSIKREDSDSVNLKGAAKHEAAQWQNGRPSLSRTSSMAGLEDAKASKKAKIEAELRDAISNLRKPNREVVGKAMAEAAERKASTVTSAKSKSPFMNFPNNDQILNTIIRTPKGTEACRGKPGSPGKGDARQPALQRCHGPKVRRVCRPASTLC